MAGLLAEILLCSLELLSVVDVIFVFFSVLTLDFLESSSWRFYVYRNISRGIYEIKLKLIVTVSNMFVWFRYQCKVLSFQASYQISLSIIWIDPKSFVRNHCGIIDGICLYLQIPEYNYLVQSSMTKCGNWPSGFVMRPTEKPGFSCTLYSHALNVIVFIFVEMMFIHTVQHVWIINHVA